MDSITAISAAVQAASAIAVVFLTLWLIRVTKQYVSLTRDVLDNMKAQLAASFHPNLRIAWLNVFTGSGFEQGVASESVSAEVELWNQGSDPIKLVKLRMFVANGDLPVGHKELDVQQFVLSPNSKKSFTFFVIVRPGLQQSKCNCRIVVNCSDLAGFSKHTFDNIQNTEGINHFLGYG